MRIHGNTLPPSAYSATTTARIPYALASRRGASGIELPTPIAQSSISRYASARLSSIQERSGATE